MRRNILPLIALLAGGCASAPDEDALAQYVGARVDDVIADRGRPSEVYNMQDGTWHYLWIRSGGRKGGLNVDLGQVALPTNSSTKRCTTVVIVDREKTVLGYEPESCF